MKAHAKVVQGRFFSKKIQKFKTKYPRINESIDGATLLLQRSPKEGRSLGEPLAMHRILHVDPPVKGYPEIWIVYSYNDNNKVKLFDIELRNSTQ